MKSPTKKNTNSRKPRRPVVETLEPRILFSADFAPGILDAPAAPDTLEQRSLDVGGEFSSLTQSTAHTRVREIVFVDAATPERQRLIDDIVGRAGDERDIEVVVLRDGRSGIEQISETLAARQDIAAVHIVSHGTDGAVSLGNARLDFDALLANASKIRTWGNALTADADLLIYGCNVAQSDAGRSLVDALARLTGADVAASDDVTGHAELGGDWELECHIGEIGTEAPISMSAMLDWRATLDGVPVGGETRVNTTTTGTQSVDAAPSRALAMNASGAYVVVWTGPDAGGTGVFAQRYDANGLAQGGEIAVNTTTANNQNNATVAIDGSGNFIVAWTSDLQDGSSAGVYARRFNADGTAASGEFRVNSTTSGSQSAPVIAMNNAGTFAIAWEASGQDGSGTGVYAQRYDATGVAQGGEFRVNTTTAGDQYMDSGAMDAAGNFVFTFASSDGSSNGVYFQRYNANGTTAGGETPVNTTTANDQSWSTVAMDPNGNFVVTWRSLNQDGAGGGIYARRYDSTGTAQGGEFRVNTTTANDQATPSVSMDADGNFVVAWASYNQDGGTNTWGIYKQEYNADGTAAGGEVRVNTTTAGSQVNPWVGMSAGRDFVVAWSGQGTGDTTGVFTQRFWDSADANVTLVYGEGSSNVPVARSYWDGVGTWSGESATATTNTDIRWTVAEKDPYSSEQIVGILSDNGSAELDVMRWTGTAWVADWAVGGLATANSDKRGFDVAYEQSSGDAMVVYANGTNLSYRVWNGTSWTAAANVFASPPTTGTVLWVELASRPGSDEIALVYSDGNNDLGAVIWNGSSWQEAGTERLLETALALTDSGSAGQYKTFDAAYENSGQLLVAWGRAANVGHATYTSGTGWSSTTTTAFVGGNITIVDLAAEAGTDRIAFAGIDENSGTARLGLGTWTGSGWVNVGQADSGFNHVFAVGNADSGYAWAGAGWVDTSGKAVVMYSDADTGRINYATWTAAGGWAVQADVLAGTAGTTMRSVQMESFSGRSELLALYSDSNGDLWAATYDGTSWTVSNAGAALETNLPGTGIVPFDFTLLTSGSAPSLAGVYQQSATTNNLVVIEAENHDARVDQGGETWTDATAQAGYSGRGYMFGGPDGSGIVGAGNETTSARLDFEVDFVTTGTHYLWVRGYANGGGTASDSVYVGLDGAYPTTAIVNDLYEAPWNWERAKVGPNAGDAPVAINVTSTGLHTLNLWIREDGVMVDKILLTTNAAYTPTGAEVESARGTIESTALAYVTGQAATVVTGLITARDGDDAAISGATVQITGNYRNGQDVLSFTNVGSVVGTWSAATGTVTFAGTDTLANYQAALRSVTYQNTSSTPDMRTRTVSFTATDSDGNSNTLVRDIALSNPSVNIDTAAGTIVVDGSAAEATWAAAATNTIATPIQGSGGSGAADLSGTWKAAWDNTNVYLLVNVSDNQRFTDSSGFWDDDSIEIYIDATNDGKSSSTYDADDGQYYFKVDGTFGVGAATTLTTAGVTRAIVDSGSGYTVEVAIPWTTLGYASPPLAGQQIGIDVHINDDDDGGGRDDKLSWESFDDLAWNDSSRFGTATLIATNSAPVAVSDSYSVNEDSTLVVSGATGWWNTSWQYRKQIAIDNFGRSALTDFPVRVALDSSNIDYAQTQNAGQDLRFVDADGTALAYEIESWNESGTSYVWVKVPQIDANSNTDYIWMYYGNAAASDGQNATAVWSNGFAAVWHLDDDLVDATSNPNDGTNFGSTDAANGIIAGGQSFDGTNDYIRVADHSSLDIGTNLTLSVWINPNDVSWYRTLLSKADSTSERDLYWYIHDGDVGVALQGVQNGDWDSGVTVFTGEWAQLTLTYDGSNITIRKNGGASSDSIARSGTLTLGTDVNPLYIGNNTMYPGEFFGGQMDEARISNVVRSADWIDAEYDNVVSAGFLTFGAAQTPSGGVLANDTDADSDPLSAVLVSNVSNGTLALNANGGFTYTPNPDFVGTDSFSYRASDGTTTSNLATVTITVNSMTPTAGDDAYSVNEDSTLTAPALTAVLSNDTDPTSDPLSAVLVSNASNGTLSLNADGSFSYTPNANFAGTDSFTYRATDGSNESNLATVTITVNPVNDAPVNSVPGAQSTATNTARVFSAANGNQITIADVDAGSSPVRVTLTGSNGTVTLAGTTGLTFSTGDGTADATMTFTGTVSAINTALNGLSFNPTTGFNGTASLQVATNDQGNTGSGGALSDSDSITITVASATPSAADDAYMVAEDGTLTVPTASGWWNTSWSQRKQLTFDNSAQTQNLTDFPVLVTLDSSRINYALTQDAGQDLRFVDADGTLLAHEIESWNESGTSYVWVRVPQIDAGSSIDSIWMYYGNAAAADGQNAAGVWDTAFDGVWHLDGDVLDSAGTNEGTNSGTGSTAGAIGSARSFDGVNDQVYTSTLFSNPQEYTIEAWFRTTAAGGDKILGFESNQTGTASGSWDRQLYVGTDGRLYFGSYDQPTDAEDVANSAATYTDGSWHYAVGVRNDATNTLLLYVDGTLVDTAANASSENYDGYWRMGGYKTQGWPNAGDGYFNGSIDEARVSSQVRSADWIRAQYLAGTDAFISYGGAQGIGVLTNDSDPNGDALTAVLVGNVSNGSLTLNANGSFTYTPNANFNGTDTFTYQANDGFGNSNIATVTITVTSVNDTPVLSLPGAALSYLEDQSPQQLDATAAVGDVEDNWSGGTLSVNISAGAQTSDRLSIVNVGGVTLSGLNVQVGGITVGTANAASVTNGSALVITFNGTATDADVQAVVRAIGFDNTNATNPPNAGRTVTFTLVDQGGDSSSATKSVSVTRVNDAPTLTATAANPTYTEGGAAATLYSSAAAATVETGQTINRIVLTVSSLADGASERLRIDGTFVALTDGNSVTTGSSSYGVGVSVTGSTATVTITTTGASTVAINTLVNNLAFENTSAGPSGTRTVTLTSIRDSGGTANGGADTTALSIASTVTLVNVNNAPAGTSDGYSVNEDAILNVAAAGVLANDTDADGNPLTALLNAGPSNAAAFSLNADGTFTYTPNADFNGTDSFTYRASDGSLQSALVTVTITVNAQNDPPVITSNGSGATASVSVAENTTAVTTVTASDVDTGATLTYSLAGGADQALFTINSTTGALTFAAGRNYELPADSGGNNVYDVIVQVSDGTATDTQAIAVTITDADEFDVGAITDANAGANSVAENVAVGTLVGLTASASDADGTTNSITYSLDDSAGGRFAIDGASGVVTVAGGLDREAASSHSITVRATSADGSASTQAFSISLIDVDEFDVTPVTDANAAANTAAENATVGTVVGITASAADADATNSAVTYSLDDSAGGRFAITGTTGVVTVASALDAETAMSHDITVRATSADGSFATATFTIAVTDVDEFDVGPIADLDGTSNSVSEAAAIGVSVGITASATDADVTGNAVTYSLTNSAGGRFAIDGLTGVVTVAAVLDAETATSHTIQVQATSADGSTRTQNFTVNVADVDEFDVGAIADGNAAADSVNENAAIGTTVGLTATAADADATNNAITYSLDDNAGGRFAISAGSGVVTVAGALDRESAASHTITVRATSADGSSSTQAFTIAVADVDEFDVGGIVDTDAAADGVAETVAIGSAVGITAAAADADATTNAITYSLDDSAGGRFAIDGSSGVVTVAAGLDAETATSHAITVRATSADGSSSTQVFSIAVGDVDEFDVGAVSDSDVTSDAVNENATVGTTVGLTALAVDADATAVVTYSLTDDAGGRFAIDAGTGVVTVAGVLDFETDASHTITVRADSNDGSLSTASFVIGVNNVNESGVSAIADSDVALNNVAEDAVAGTVVGLTALATDPDLGDTVTYSLTDDAGGRFSIDASTGVVTVLGGLDRETGASHSITIRADSLDTSFSTQTFVIAVSDVDEFDVGAVTDANPAADAVNENAANGTAVGITATAADADATVNGITYSLDDTAGGRFAVNATTGVVTVANGSLLDREAAASHGIIVRATSADGSSSTQAFVISVGDVDEFDVGAVTDANAAPDSLAENVVNGTTVGITASAADADATTNGIAYTLDDDAGGRFAIDGVTGAVSVANSGLLDREAAASHSITVRATSLDGSFSTQAFTVIVTDVDEFDVAPIADGDAAADSVAENAANGSLVGFTAAAADADATNNAITYSLDDDASGRFAIDAVTGVVSVADGSLLDREAAASHTITVRATSADGSAETLAVTIGIADVDEFDTGVVTDADAALDEVAENAANATAVGVIALATDADATGNVVSYSLDDSAGGRFAIDGVTGVVTVANGALLDREAAASHDITVRATSADGSSSTQAFTIALADADEFDVGPIADVNGAAEMVAENAAVGTLVGVTAQAADADATTNAVSYSLDDSAGGRFSIEGATGVVRVAGAIDREAAASYDITVRATSADGSTTTQVFTILVADVDEFDVGAVTDAAGAADTVAENAVNGTLVGVTAAASDADATTNGIGYGLDDDAGGRFAIDGATGVVRVADGTLLDREAAASHTITVRATSADGSTSTQVFTIALGDVDEFDVGAISDGDAAADVVVENAVNGTAVGVIATAADADATNSGIAYSLDDDAGGRFTIDAGGVVRVADGTLLDREAASSHTITVRATSADGSTSIASFVIAVADADEFDVGVPVDADATANSVAESVAIGSTVGITAFAADVDATTSGVTYTLDDDAGGLFDIDAVSGVVSVAAALDAEAAASHDIVVRATSADGSTASQTFTIAVTDVNEAPVGPISDVDLAANAVAENAVAGTVVNVTALAADPDLTASVTYSLDDDAGGRFGIDAVSGVVTVAGAIDREAAASHTITVRATSTDGSFSTQSLVIAVADVDEADVGPVSDVSPAANSVAENAAIGAQVGLTAFAADADATNNAITYSLDDTAGGRFAIDAATGIVTVAGALDAEAAASHNIIVRATSADGSSNSQSFNIVVSDVDEFDVGAVTDADATGDSVAENATNGTAVGITASAADTDLGTNAITYALDVDAGGRFAIDAVSGVVTVADGSLLDRESASSHAITVRATSADGSTSTQVFTIGIGDVDEFDVGTVVDADAGPETVSESAVAGTAVGLIAAAADADATANAITYTLDNDAGGRFAIDPVSGVVTVAGGVDAETAVSHGIVVRATSADGSSSTQAYAIAVTDADEFDVGAIADTNATADAVLENAVNGTPVGITAAAQDADATTNGIVYALDDDAGGRFAIDAGTGVVTVADGTLLDREAAASYGITVRATSADGSSSTRAFTIALGDVDEFAVGPLTDTDAAADGVTENAANGSSVGITGQAADGDASGNTITYSLDNDAGGRFAIDPMNGVVTVADGSLLDREAAASHGIVLRATSADGSFSTRALTVAVGDLDEFDVGAVSDWDAAPDTVNENIAVGTMVGVAAGAADADATNSTITYTLDDSAGGRFAIDPTTGVVTVAGALDFELAASRDIVVRATSADSSFSSQTFTIAIANVDEAPALIRNTMTVAQGGSVVLSGSVIAATDPDTPASTLVLTASGVQAGRFELVSTPGVAVSSFTQAQINAGQVVFVQDGSAEEPAYALTVSDGTSSVGPFAGAVKFSTAAPAVLEEESETEAPAYVPPPAVDFAAVKATPAAETAQARSPILLSEFSPGRPDSNFNDILAQSIELKLGQARPLPKLVQPVLSVNDYEQEEPIDPLLQLFTFTPASLEYRASTPVDWEVAAAFEEGFQDQAQEQLQVLLDSVKFGGMALSVGVVWWASRISAMLGSLLASAPAWKHIDPLPVVNDADEEEKQKWLEPDERALDFDADELAVALVLDTGGGQPSTDA